VGLTSNDTNQHEVPDDANSFSDWRRPYFLELCDRYRDTPACVLAAFNGVFDLFHVGHVQFLEYVEDVLQREYPGKRVLLVALLNTDASAARLKGPHRPYMPLAARLWTVAMSRHVGAAAGFDEDTPEDALARIKPQILFKGSEYDGRPIPGAQHCTSVRFVPMAGDHHTTAIERKVVQAYLRGDLK